MMSSRWEHIIESISYVKPECIDKEKIKSILRYDRTHDAQVLDNLYLLKVLTRAEYKAALSKYADRVREEMQWIDKRLDMVNEKGDEYNPMIFYGFGRPYMGAAIEYEEHKN